MADKLLKSIKFPTLPDRYVIGDTTLTEAGAAAEAKAVGDALATKADTSGTYEDLIVGGAEQLMSDEYETDKDPYLFRTTGGSADVGNREYVDKIVGGTVAWNQLVNYFMRGYINSSTAFSSDGFTFTATAQGGRVHYLVPAVKGHKYYFGASIRLTTATDDVSLSWYGALGKRFAATTNWQTVHNIIDNTFNSERNWQIQIIDNRTSDWDAIQGTDVFCIDLTAMFNPTIADYIYSLEQSQAGAGVAWFRRYFPEDYYPYDAGTLKSVQTSAHKTYDADGNVIRTYPLDSSLTLRGVPKLADGKLAFDGDVYPPSGEVQRRYGLRAYQSGDESLTDAITDGTNTVYKLTTPTTETADGYEQYQICDPSGTEEFVTTGIVPVGHETRYPHDLKKKLETAPDSPSADGTYLMKRSGGKNTYMALPSTPSANGAYVLTVTVSGGTASYSWTAKE